MVVAISSRTNYRKDINPLYKANRKSTRRPLCLAPLLDFVKEDYNHVILDNIEADDVMGILATQDPDKYLIVSDDKDMLTIPDARIWKDGEVVHITARKLIDKHRGTPWSLWEGVLKAYKGDEEEAVLNARMARILTDDLWDGDKPILWEPPIKEEVS